MASGIVVATWHDCLIDLPDEVGILDYIGEGIGRNPFNPARMLQCFVYKRRRSKIDKKYPNPLALDGIQGLERLREIYGSFNRWVADGLRKKLFDSLVEEYVANTALGLVDRNTLLAIRDARNPHKNILTSAYKGCVKTTLERAGFGGANPLFSDEDIMASNVEVAGSSVSNLRFSNQDSHERRSVLEQMHSKYGINHKRFAFMGSDTENDALCFDYAGVVVVPPLASDFNRQRIATAYGRKVRTPRDYAETLRALTT